VRFGPGVPSDIDLAAGCHRGRESTRSGAPVADDVVGTKGIGGDEAIVGHCRTPTVVIRRRIHVVIAISEPSTIFFSIDRHLRHVSVACNEASRGEKTREGSNLGHGHGQVMISNPNQGNLPEV
jgi:hypothetical protein